MIEVLSICNRHPVEGYYTWTAFHESLARFGFKALLLGWQEEWKGLMTKPRKLREWLRKGESKADLVAVCDSWDSVWQKSPAKMEDEFSGLGIDILIGAERSCFPDHSLAESHPKTASSFRYVNTGLILAKPKALLEFLEDMNLDAIPDDGEVDSNPHPNDQNYVMRQFLRRRQNTMLDSRTQFVANLCGVGSKEIDLSGELVKVSETGSAPFVLHFNGPAKTNGLREPILKKLKLTY